MNPEVLHYTHDRTVRLLKARRNVTKFTAIVTTTFQWYTDNNFKYPILATLMHDFGDVLTVHHSAYRFLEQQVNNLQCAELDVLYDPFNSHLFGVCTVNDALTRKALIDTFKHTLVIIQSSGILSPEMVEEMDTLINDPCLDNMYPFYQSVEYNTSHCGPADVAAITRSIPEPYGNLSTMLDVLLGVDHVALEHRDEIKKLKTAYMLAVRVLPAPSIDLDGYIETQPGYRNVFEINRDTYYHLYGQFFIDTLNRIRSTFADEETFTAAYEFFSKHFPLYQSSQIRPKLINGEFCNFMASKDRDVPLDL